MYAASICRPARIVWACAMVLAGCVTPTEVAIDIDLDDGLRAEATTLVLRSSGPDSDVTEERIELADVALPVSKYIIPRGGDHLRSYRVVVTLLRADGRELLARTIVGAFAENELRRIRIRLEADCVGVSCAAGRSCVSGTCAPDCYGDEVDDEGYSAPIECTTECAGLPDTATCAVGNVAGTCRQGACCTGCWDHSTGECLEGDDPLSCGYAGRECMTCCGEESCGSTGCAIGDARVRNLVAATLQTCASLSSPEGYYCFGSKATRRAGDPEIIDVPTRMGGGGRPDVSETGYCVASYVNGVGCWGDDNLSHGLSSISDIRFDRVAVGRTHACAIREDADADIYCWGFGAQGQFGRVGAGNGPNAPMAIDKPGPYTHVTSERQFTCALHGEGTWWCWGAKPQLIGGLPAEAWTAEPFEIRVRDGEDVRFAELDAGPNSACALDTEGRLYCIGGSNCEAADGEFAVLQDEGPFGAVSVGISTVCVTGTGDRQGDLLCRGAVGFPADGEPDACEFTTYTSAQDGWADVAVGQAHACALRSSDRTLWCFGSNESGQVGVPGLSRAEYPVRVCFP